MSGLPQAQGLYDPANEHDACGVGFVADVRGERSHAIVRDALTLLDNLSHRSAVGCDPCTGDGSGVLLQLPHAFLRRAARDAGVRLPEDEGAYGVGMVFLPAAPEARRAAELTAERCAAAEGLALLGWRDVPTDAAQVGELARRSVPVVRQLFVARPPDADADAFERKLYVLRRRIERASREEGPGCYLPSLSARTVVYKGLLRPDQLPRFYADLAESDVVSALALVHSRFSTNTFPTWPLAHPFRYVCHNGEINTLRGNVSWMRVREARMASPLFGDDLPKLFPVIGAGQSDSACFDNAVELLVMGGRSLAHAMAMLIPEAWEGHQAMDADRRAFYEYHAGLMEPWDGPAALAFTDGRQIGATLDRNGLRPARYAVTGDRVVLASEAGALPLPPDEVRAKGRLQPGRMLLVDTVEGRIVDDEEIKAGLATRRPYRRWLAERRVLLPAAAPPAGPALGDGELSAGAAGQRTLPLQTWQRAFGYTIEEAKMVLAPMAESGEEAVGSMGNDTPLAVLSERPQLLYKYFKQLFAQVTNPAIDPIREQLVMSLGVRLGPEGNLLDETPAQAAQLRLAHPLLTAPELARVRQAADQAFGLATLRTLFPVSGGPGGLATALDVLCRDAASAVRAGAGVLLLSDRGVGARWAPIPSLLATAAVHHHLLREGLRARCGLMVESGDAREVAHVALLVGYGAAAVHPYVALETVADLARGGAVPGAPDEAVAKYVKAVGKGLLKILSKMGISTVQSYCGAQVFEAVGLDAAMVARHFAGTSSRIGGAGLEVIAEEALRRHAAAYGAAYGAGRAALAPEADFGGEYHVRAQGEHHGWNAQTIATLQHAARRGSYETFKQFSRLADADGAAARTLRGLLDFAPANDPVPLDEVEPASEIVKRFATGAMSFGSISREAHETLALAMNRLGGRSNTGEGGEDPARYGGPRNSAIKQVASARFGVTTEYLVHARELQIKIAQGAKPGEGGQLPGHKVDEVIARTRHATPGVTLISPPPHHDIYSIEDLAQLIYDLKNVNPRATVSVKLVAEAGVGTVAAGVAKAHADLIVISGDSGGTGASPLSSIKHAGIPWELGLAETQQTLVLNGLRSRVRLQTDGQLKTGRDVVIAALLGAEEFGFATAPLIVEGCVMMRKCHLNTCPVGIATQDPELREKFTGQPEHVVNFFFFVAEEVRELMARLGVRRMDDLVGRVEWLRSRVPADHWKARTLDLGAMLHEPPAEPASGMGDGGRRRSTDQAHGLEAALDHELLRLAAPALERGERVSIALPVRNVHRTVGAMLSGEIARRYGQAGLPDGTIEVALEGSAGQSFGAFAARGLTLTLEGEANDYVGKGLSGGRLVVYPPAGAGFPAEQSIIVGNTVLYGATSGEAYFRGSAGERFAVRNSGAVAVVEGVGDHGCEYMTGGVVVVLGRTGRNFAAGMSGGVAYVLDTEAADFAARCNTALVELGPVRDAADGGLLRDLVERHARFTGSARAAALLERWDESLPRFVRVMPMEYQRALQEQARRSAAILASDVPQIRYA
ncbi:MAG TPA: glutamate synthase large subunit [Gemmatimonadaceae bacterium]|nr:glutamate synthase large subunit [Gemmatimonadaceae bacterium]